MKKKFLIFLFVLSCVVLTNFVNAYQIEDYLKIDNIDDLENAYGVTPVAEAIRLDDYTGGIFTHYDSSFASWIHGHAAIGYGIGTIEIMNYKETVKQYFGGRTASPGIIEKNSKTRLMFL